jgi:hypothetical protein
MVNLTHASRSLDTNHSIAYSLEYQTEAVTDNGEEPMDPGVTKSQPAEISQ